MKILIGSTALVAALVFQVSAATVSLPVSGSANIFGARPTAPPAPGGGGGGLPPALNGFSARPDRVITFPRVSGTISLTPGLGVSNGPDGNASSPTDISSFGGLAGIRSDSSGFLAGVFLGPTVPSDPTLPVLDFRSAALGTSFLTLAPQLGQVFFIGDGLTGTGSGTVQQFFAPPTATRLYLGFADALAYEGLAGHYQDNIGTLNVTVQIVPEPGIWVMLGLGFLGWYAMRAGCHPRVPGPDRGT